MTNLEILVAARSAIADPKNWLQGIRSMDGAYCALGALDTVVQNTEHHPATMVLETSLLQHERKKSLRRLKTHFGNHIPENCPKSSIVAQFNNTHTHSEVIAAFDRAIERCRMVDRLADVLPHKAAELVSDWTSQ